MEKNDRILFRARLAQVGLAPIALVFIIIIITRHYSNGYLVYSAAWSIFSTIACGALGKFASDSLKEYADFSFYRRIHPMMFTIDCMAVVFNGLAIPLLSAAGSEGSFPDTALWVVAIFAAVLCLCPSAFLLYTSSRIWWRGMVTSAVAGQLNSEQHWGVHELGGYGSKSIPESTLPTKIDPNAERDQRRATSSRSHPLTTIPRTVLSDPGTLPTTYSTTQAPSYAAPLYISN